MKKSSQIAETEQILKLKIRLAELEPEKAPSHSFVPHEPERLRFKTWGEIEQFVRENCGVDNPKWIPLEVAGEILILPRDQFKPELN